MYNPFTRRLADSLQHLNTHEGSPIFPKALPPFSPAIPVMIILSSQLLRDPLDILSPSAVSYTAVHLTRKPLILPLQR